MVVNESLSSTTALMDVFTPPVLLFTPSGLLIFPSVGLIKETAQLWKMSSFTSLTVTWSLIGWCKHGTVPYLPEQILVTGAQFEWLADRPN